MLLVLVLTLAAAATPPEVANASAWSPPPGKRFDAPPPNDQCAGAIVLSCGNINESGNTATATNNYSFVDTTGSCTGYASYGNDVVYKVNVGAGDSIWVDYRNRLDGSIYIVTNCNDIENTCVAGADNEVLPNSVEELRYGFQTAGIYYIILDSHAVAPAGDLWTMSGQLICGPQTPPHNDLCETAIPLQCGSFSLSGNVQYATNNLQFSTTPYYCTGFQASGPDVIYRLSVGAGDSIWVNYTNNNLDGSIYIVADCEAVDGTCIWGSDQNSTGQVEPFRYRFEFAGVYYLVLDARSAGAGGTWTAVGELICLNPPPVNDRCANAIQFSCGPFSAEGTTQYAVNDYFYGQETGCTGFEANGRDVVFKFQGRPGDTLYAQYRSINSDGAMLLVRNCEDVVNSCVMGVDTTVTSEYENLTYVMDQVGFYYLILDSVDLESWSSWTLTGRYGCRPAAVDPREPATRLALREISPNPSMGRTQIFYEIPIRGHTTLRIYDLQGRVLRTLVDADLSPGQHHLVWDGRNSEGQRLSAGIYFAKLMSGTAENVQRVIFVR
jgi:hypothetical protein